MELYRRSVRVHGFHLEHQVSGFFFDGFDFYGIYVNHALPPLRSRSLASVLLIASNTSTAYTSTPVTISWKYASQFDSAPGTSIFGTSQGATNDELHIIVVDTDGKFTGERYTVTNQNPDGTDSINRTGRIIISGNSLPSASDILQVDYLYIVF